MAINKSVEKHVGFLTFVLILENQQNVSKFSTYKQELN